VVGQEAGAAKKYWLRRHIFLCTAPDSVVFLDTRRDSYFGLSGPQLAALAKVVKGWPKPAHLEHLSPALSQDEAERIADRYVQAGLLTCVECSGKPATPVALELNRNLVTIRINPRALRRVRFSDCMNFFLSCLSAALVPRFRTLESAVNWAAGRKARAASTGDRIDGQEVAELVGIFRKLRVLAPWGRNRCVFQALVLINFLARYNQFPTWIIGVRTHPWAAHSWVQQGDTLLDATPELVRFYTPILAV
jgi:hypothetical protein